MTRPIQFLAMALTVVALTSCGAPAPGSAQPDSELSAAVPAASGNASYEIELVDVELCHKQNALAESNIEGFTSFLPPDSLICRARPDLLRAFDGFSVLFGTLSVACSFPGPAQVALPVFSVSGAAVSLLSFGLKGISCEEPEPKLTSAQIEVVEAKVCQMIGKTYRKGLGPVERSRCE